MAIVDLDSPAATHQPPLRIALLERDPVIAGLYIDALRRHTRDCEVTVIDFDDPNLAEGLMRAEVCICPAGAESAGRFDNLVRLLLLRPELPVVVLLSACQSARLDQALELGAADVMLRTTGYLDQLPATVRRVALHARGVGFADVRTRVLQESLRGIQQENRTLLGLIERLESLAATDPLTGLLNRRAFDRAMGRAFATSRRYGHELSCLIIDADGFKRVNDAAGHATGDRLLKLIAEVIVAECRQSDAAGRLGGDEFAVLLPHTGPREAAAVAERLRRRFVQDARTVCGAGELAERLGLTIGVACRSDHAPLSPAQLIEAADAALYTGKRNGRNCVVLAALPNDAASKAA